MCDKKVVKYRLYKQSKSFFLSTRVHDYDNENPTQWGAFTQK